MGPKFLIFYSLILLERKVYSALKIQECPAGMINVTEDDEISLTCDQYSNTIYWYISSDNTLGNYSGYCSERYCESTKRNQFRIDAEWSSWSWTSWSYKSTLDITTVTRKEARFFHCKNYYSAEKASCRLRVTVPAIVVLQNCSVGISNWEVQGECPVRRMYASDDDYKCTWSVNNVESTGVFQKPLTQYRNGSRTYMRGVCSFRQAMTSYEYSYTYRISIDPGPENQFVQTINIDGPSDVDISLVASENGTETLRCTAIDVFPSALFHWNIFCDKRTDTFNTSTCTLLAPDTNDEIVVVCTANNTAFPHSSVTKNFIVSYPRTKMEISSSGTEQRIRDADEQNAHSKDSSSSDSINGGLIGGVVAAVMFAIIIGTVIVVFIVKRRKEKFNSQRFTSRLWPCIVKFFRKKTPLSTPYATVNKPKSETPLKRLAAPSGDLYTRATNTISLDVSGDYVTVSDTMENPVTGMDRDCTFMENQFRHEPTELTEAVKLTMNPKPTTARTKNIQDTTGIVYMNVTEVPTDSGLGVYHIVPWRTMAAEGETENMNDSTKAVSDDEYNVLSFEEDRFGQEDQAATYHHLEHE